MQQGQINSRRPVGSWVLNRFDRAPYTAPRGSKGDGIPPNHAEKRGPEFPSQENFCEIITSFYQEAMKLC